MSDTSPHVKRFLWFFFGCLVTALILDAVRSPDIARAKSRQSEMQTSSDLISARAKQLLDYEQDFLDLSKARGAGSLEFEVAMGLHDIAERVQDHLDAASTLVWIYESVSCVPDKIKIRPMVSSQLSFYVALMGSEVSMVNNNLAYTTAPGVATTANQMKADIRSAQTMLASIAQNSL